VVVDRSDASHYAKSKAVDGDPCRQGARSTIAEPGWEGPDDALTIGFREGTFAGCRLGYSPGVRPARDR
jgi:hypothetical protein